MKKIKVDCSMITRDPTEASKVSKNLEDLGYDGAYTFEGPHEPFLPLAAAALATEKLELSTSKAGGCGVLGAVGMTPEQLEEELKWIDDHIDGLPYGVDVLIPNKAFAPSALVFSAM